MTPADPHHPDELLDAWLDDRLDPDPRRRVDDHLAGCERCRRQVEVLRAAVAAVRTGLPAEPAPASLAARIRAALDAEDARAGEAGAARPEVAVDDAARPTDPRPAVRPVEPPEATALPLPAPPSSRWRWPWVAAAAAAAVAVVALSVWLAASGSRSWLGPPPAADLVADADAAYATLHRGGLPADLATTDAAAVEQRWLRAGLGFPARVLDLGAMDIHLAGGGATTLAGHPAAVTAYRGGGVGLLVCWMLQASAAELPAGAEVREKNGFEFHLYRRGERTVVFWQEGEVLCALAGSGDPEAVLTLAVAKAMAPAARGSA